MNQKVLRSVEYTTILERLASLAQSAPGKELCLSLSPMRDLVDIEKAQGETQAAVALLDSGSDVSFGSNRDITEVLRALKIQSSLTAPELLHLASFLENVARVKLSCPEDQKNPLFDLFDCLYPLSPLSQEIRRCILAEDQIADDASPELKRIRRQRNLTDDKIHQLLSRLVTQTYSSYLQDTVITMRDDRYCLPVKAEYKSQVKGIVHDASSTGSTGTTSRRTPASAARQMAIEASCLRKLVRWPWLSAMGASGAGSGFARPFRSWKSSPSSSVRASMPSISCDMSTPPPPGTARPQGV